MLEYFVRLLYMSNVTVCSSLRRRKILSKRRVSSVFEVFFVCSKISYAHSRRGYRGGLKVGFSWVGKRQHKKSYFSFCLVIRKIEKSIFTFLPSNTLSANFRQNNKKRVFQKVFLCKKNFFLNRVTTLKPKSIFRLVS